MCGCGQSTSGAVDISCCANWDLALARYYFLDNQNGSDNNVGYIDAAPGTVFTTVQAQGVAIKTFRYLREILPPIGNNRTVVILMKVRTDSTIAPGTGNYVDGITQEYADWRGISGYRYISRRGSSDLTNSITDRAQLGPIIAIAGPAPNNAWQVDVGATTSVIPFKTNVIAAKGAIGYRIRFTSGALNGTSAFISNNTASTITVGTNLGSAPAQDDTFVIESAGLKFVGTYEMFGDSWPAINGITNTNSQSNFVGVTFTGAATRDVSLGTVNDVRYSFMFTEAVGNNNVIGTMRGPVACSFTSSYLDETGTTRTTGHGLRHASPMSASLLALFSSAIADVSANGSLLFVLGSLNHGQGGSYSKGGILVFSGGIGSPNGNLGLNNSATRQIGNNSASSRDLLIDGVGSNTNILNGGLAGITIQGDSSLRLVGTAFNNMGNNPAVRPVVMGGAYDFEGLTGSAGNTDVGIDFTQCYNATFNLGLQVANTVTGTAGDIRTGGSLIQTHANYLVSSYRDENGNFLQGTAKNTSYPGEWFYGRHLGDAGAVFEFMAKYNLLLGAAAKYPSRARWYRGISVQPQNNTCAANVTVTLFKNGVATAMTVTILAGSNALVTDYTHPIQFAAGDLLDLVVNSTAAGAGNHVDIATFLEYT